MFIIVLGKIKAVKIQTGLIIQGQNVNTRITNCIVDVKWIWKLAILREGKSHSKFKARKTMYNLSTRIQIVSNFVRENKEEMGNDTEED